MGKELAEKFTVAADTLAEADTVLGRPITRLCFEGPEEELARTEVTQPALLAVEVACLRVLLEQGVKPAAAAGHSLGEYAALVAAGSLTFADALRVVDRRGRLMAAACEHGKGGMAAVLGLDSRQVEEICRRVKAGLVEPANFNAPGQVVIAGEKEGLKEAAELAGKAGARRVVPLKVGGPFHSSLMEPAAEGLKGVLCEVEVADPRIPVVANVSADYIKGAGEIPTGLVEQVARPVRWEETIERLVQDGYGFFVEVGPGSVLSGLIRRIAPQVTVTRVEDPDTLNKTLALLREGM
ncbi:MAG TPA: [acyl-carrier-protein] S-malonyltransferase [Peptococcaceae bacterium]|nr:[acyl-carrier-protein] S-malonyltransferase [Peptococcaceae bacterium]